MHKYASLSTTYLILQIYKSSIGDKIHTKTSALFILCELRHAISINEAVLHEKTQTSPRSLLLSSETPNAVLPVA